MLQQDGRNHMAWDEGNHVVWDEGNHVVWDEGNHVVWDEGNHKGLPLQTRLCRSIVRARLIAPLSPIASNNHLLAHCTRLSAQIAQMRGDHCRALRKRAQLLDGE